SERAQRPPLIACTGSSEPCRLHESSQQFAQGVGSGLGAGRVLTSDQAPVDDSERLPVAGFLIACAKCLELVFDKERHHVSQFYSGFFAVGETSHPATFRQRLTIRSLDVAQYSRRMADEADWLTGAL